MSLDNNKEKIISSLLGDSREKKKQSILIEEINHAANPPHLPSSLSFDQLSPASTPEGPSLLQMMIEAQKAATKEQEKEKAVVQAKESKKSFSGFKKGFFGDKKTNDSQLKSSKAPSSSTGKAASEDVLDLKPTTPTQINASKKPAAPVLADVQTALKEDANEKITSMLTQNKEWLTNDLMLQFQANSVLAKGFQNPKCVAAMQLLQSNPQEALERFKHDEEVSAFLKEFGRVMSGHFLNLAEQKQKEEELQKPPKAIQEIGPLQAQALTNARKEQETKTTSKAENAENRKGTEEEEQVKKILEDKELRELLMDSELQKILLECSNQERFRFYMSQPEVASKIRKLQRAGLVKVEL